MCMKLAGPASAHLRVGATAPAATGTVSTLGSASPLLHTTLPPTVPHSTACGCGCRHSPVNTRSSTPTPAATAATGGHTLYHPTHNSMAGSLLPSSAQHHLHHHRQQAHAPGPGAMRASPHASARQACPASCSPQRARAFSTVRRWAGDDEDDEFDRSLDQHSPISTAQAAQVMQDPMAMLLASRGMPLGISLPMKKREAPTEEQRSPLPQSAAPLSTASGEPANDESPSSPSPPPSAAAAAAAAPPPPAAGAEGGYQMEAMDELFDAASGATPGGGDAWGTTRESAEDIARRIAGPADGPGGGDDSPAEEDEVMTFRPEDPKHADLEAMTKDIKGLDEVWEILASVPWLDDNIIVEKELKGVAMFSLLGTLEEVGFGIRSQLDRIWAGERNDDIILESVQPREQAALISIMYHTKQLETKHGAPASYIPRPPSTPTQPEVLSPFKM
ncbi:MAG: hypothetical protein WDW36_009601 [Sanguina aurantia]